MGGWGSGRIFWFGSTRRVAGSSCPLDIRKLKRDRLLYPGCRITSTWSRNGTVHASIGAIVHDDQLVLKYTYREKETVELPVPFSWTRCNFGGKRIWFVCPCCGRRCAVIYSIGKYFGCRTCGNLAYSTQNETWRGRLFTKANKLRKKIGADPGAASPLPIFKPKGMHQKTWGRFRWQIEILEGRGFVELDRMMDRLPVQGI